MTYETPKGAELSDCGAYRYTLWRKWGTKPPLNFVLLNPSTADAERDDATIRKLVGFAKRIDAGGIFVTNLFAFRSKDPADLLRVEDPVGPRNDAAILDAAGRSAFTVCGWGNDGRILNRSAEVRRLLRGRSLFAFELNKSGEPKHPLYVSYATRFQPLEELP